MLISVNPSTGQELSRYPLHEPSAVENALEAAAHAQAGWRSTALPVRVQALRRIATVLRGSASRYAGLISLEMGKPIGEAIAEVEKCARNCEFYAEKAAAFLADEPVAGPSARYTGIAYEPLGIVLAVMPWNYPLWQFFRFLAPALAAGNGVILKHAANVPACALACEQIVREADVPDGLVKTVFVATEGVAGLIADPRISAVTFTGSTHVGSLIAAQAGRALKKQVLELGGSDPFIVLADADVAGAARAALSARFTNAGQSCVNAKRFIVDEAVADEFVSAFVDGIAGLVSGDPMDAMTTLGPLARADLRETLNDQVLRSVQAGGVLRTGGAALERAGFYYAPTLIDHVRPGSPAFREETFGPVAAVTRVSGIEEAIQRANDTSYGLGASLWTSDLPGAERLVARIDAGAVFVNATVMSDPHLPFGGIKRSGYGRELGCHGIREFTNIKTVWVG